MCANAPLTHVLVHPHVHLCVRCMRSTREHRGKLLSRGKVPSQCPGITACERDRTEQDSAGWGGPERNLHSADSGLTDYWLTQGAQTH